MNIACRVPYDLQCATVLCRVPYDLQCRTVLCRVPYDLQCATVLVVFLMTCECGAKGMHVYLLQASTHLSTQR